jgi:hypothetical protein
LQLDDKQIRSDQVWGRSVEVLNQPFYADVNLAIAGGCLASQYLAAWVIARFEGLDAAKSAMHYVAPVGEKSNTLTGPSRISHHICLPNLSLAGAGQ